MSKNREVTRTSDCLAEISRGDMITLRMSVADDSLTQVVEVARVAPDDRRVTILASRDNRFLRQIDYREDLIVDFSYEGRVCFVHASIARKDDTTDPVSVTLALKRSALLLQMRGSSRHEVYGKLTLHGDSGQKLLEHNDNRKMNLSSGGFGLTVPRRLVESGQELDFQAVFSPPPKVVRKLSVHDHKVPRCELSGRVEVRHVHERPAHTGDSASYAGFKILKSRAEVDRAGGKLELEEFLEVIASIDDLMDRVEAGGDLPYEEDIDSGSDEAGGEAETEDIGTGGTDLSASDPALDGDEGPEEAAEPEEDEDETLGEAEDPGEAEETGRRESASG